MLILTKLLILIICAFMQFNVYGVNALNISIVLIALIISTLPTIISSEWLSTKSLRLVTNIIWSIYLIVSIFIPALRCYIPLAIMDIVGQQLILTGIITAICIILECLNGFIFKGVLSTGIYILLFSGVSSLLQIVITRNENLAQELRLLRDNSKEHELFIEEKNRRLIEHQDADIYAATLRERNRIAREIHDNVGHMLTRSILQVGAIKTINTNEALAEPLQGLHDTLNTAMTNIRSSVHDLHDESLDLESAIHEIIDAVDNVNIHLQYGMSNDIPKNIKYCFISITKEAVNNVLKHSNATSMDIIIQEHPAFYQLLIEDNGTGSNIDISEGIGLTNMRDRIKNLNGNIKISTDNGFKILISIIKTRSVEE